jgi:hypothetical protein
MLSQIHPFYRLFFPTIDPIIAFTGVLAQVLPSLQPLILPSLQPLILNSYDPAYPSDATPPISTSVQMEIFGGALLAGTLLQTILLRL